MTLLIAGLLIFLGAHSVRIVADDWRSGRIKAWGATPWKLGYTVVSIAGFALIVVGYIQARQQPIVLWPALPFMRHVTALLMLIALVLLSAAYLPRSNIKLRLRHPMLLATKTWAFAHLLANNTLHDALLFGSFLVWAALCFRASRRRDRALAPEPAVPADRVQSLLAIVLGLVLWGVIAFWAHQLVIGVAPV